MEERRKSPRIDLHLSAEWETTSGVHVGTVINCSEGGCFVQAQVEEPGDEPMKLAIQLPNGGAIQLWGKVAYYLPTLGFGLQFSIRSDEGQLMLNRWRDYLQAHTPLPHRQGTDTKSFPS
ncbi:MAG TPA: PilZ domain-containing protein [Pyrinomonadaceae bacterium]|nr:PilZ domain-containing protein [Pyrinomonadaceae bacterium]